MSLGATPVMPVLHEVAADLELRADRAGVTLLVVEGTRKRRVEVRPRMLRVVAQNLAENALRYAGPETTARLAASRTATASC